MDYPNYDEITDPRPTLPPELVEELEPWFQAGQRACRDFRQRFKTDQSIWEEERRIVIGQSADIFCVQVVRLMKNRPPNIDEFRQAISLETGAGRTAFQYAHFLYRDVHGGLNRMLGLWHRDIRNRLFELVNDAEDWWYAHRVPTGWERYVVGAPQGLPVPEVSQAVSVSAVEESDGVAGTPSGDATCSAVETGRSPREMVDAFLQNCLEATGVRITKKMIWRAAGYTQRSEFDRWQAEKPSATKSANASFRRILAMSPLEFIALLKRKNLLP